MARICEINRWIQVQARDIRFSNLLVPILVFVATVCLNSPFSFAGNVTIDVARDETQGKMITTILILGDSLSAGYGIPEGKGWVHLLQQKMEEASPLLKVVNDSISGDTTAGGLARLPESLEKLNPDWVVIALGGNDGLRGQSLKAMSQNIAAMIQLSRTQGSRVLLLGMKLPPNYGKQYTERFEQVYEKLSANTNTPLLPFYIDGVGGKPEYMQQDRIHPNTQAQQIIQQNVWRFMKPYVLESYVIETAQIRS